MTQHVTVFVHASVVPTSFVLVLVVANTLVLLFVSLVFLSPLQTNSYLSIHDIPVRARLSFFFNFFRATKKPSNMLRTLAFLTVPLPGVRGLRSAYAGSNRSSPVALSDMSQPLLDGDSGDGHHARKNRNRKSHVSDRSLADSFYSRKDGSECEMSKSIRTFNSQVANLKCMFFATSCSG